MNAGQPSAGLSEVVHQPKRYWVAANAEYNGCIDRRQFRRGDHCACHDVKQRNLFPLKVSRRFFGYFQIALGIANDQRELPAFLQAKFTEAVTQTFKNGV
jgi:hypothetical protein